MKWFVILVLFVESCSQPQRVPYDTFDHPMYLKMEIVALVNSAVENKMKFSEFQRQIRSRFGTIYSVSRYSKTSKMLGEQNQLGSAEWVESLNLSEGETLISMSLDADQDCNVICDENRNVIRSAME